MNRVNEKISRSEKNQGEISQALVMINLRLCAFQLRETSYRPSAKILARLEKCIFKFVNVKAASLNNLKPL